MAVCSSSLITWSLILAAAAAAVQQEPAADPFLWLEEVDGTKALQWVERRNASTLALLEKHPAYKPIFDRALAILDSQARIPAPAILGERIYNFWQDAANPRGLWRRTTWDSYLSGSPAWEAVIDVDALAKREGQPWAWSGATCLPPEYRRCLVRLSRGGSDAAEVREFDLETLTFVDQGFRLPQAKQSAAWIDGDTVLVASDFGPGSLTTSGYARIAKVWRRGTPLESARTLYEAPPSDMIVGVGSIQTASRRYVIVSHRRNFYEGTSHILDGEQLVQLDVPLDADPLIVHDRLLVYVRTPWQVEGRTFPTGTLIDTPLRDFLGGTREFTTVLEPGPRETIEGVSTTRDDLLVSMLNNVRGELRRYRFENGRWTYAVVSLPGMGSVGVSATSPYTNRYFLTYSRFTQPTTQYVSDETGAVREVRRLPEMFDASGLLVEQREVASTDGTLIPYFIVRRSDLRLDGDNPTLLHAYGGFEVAMTPAYSAVAGAAWLERGGVYVVANIRGGGEFGPSWHRAALKAHRQRAYDDFFAVAEDLVKARITSPERLGIMGGSNGGLLMGVAMTQRPELFGAIVIQVPLLDMRRYNQLLAGASWTAEYGDPDKPDEWAYISRYSPYHNLKPDAKYPPVLFLTTTRDDRVHPGHARKMAARMEAMGHPFYYFENTEGGHGAGVTNAQRARMQAVMYAYLWERLSTTRQEGRNQ